MGFRNIKGGSAEQNGIARIDLKGNLPLSSGQVNRGLGRRPCPHEPLTPLKKAAPERRPCRRKFRTVKSLFPVYTLAIGVN